MKYHKLAEYFPILEGDEFEQLKQDIKDNGQLEPIITYQGEILDGVNRYRAISELDGVEPLFEEYTGIDPLRYVISANVRRRHLTTSQRAILATELLPVLESEARQRKGKGKTGSEDPVLVRDGQGYARATSQAAKEFNVSMPSVKRAKRIKEQAPERIPDIMVGKSSIRAIDQELRKKRAEEKRKAKQDKADLNERRGNPHEVKEYYDALKMYKAYLKVHKGEVEKAIKVARFGKFPPEAKNFTQNKHSGLIDMMNEIQDLYDELERSI